MNYHNFPPLYNSESEVLILGSFPSVKSREQGFYYGHPQNRFWKILSHLFSSPLPKTVEEKKKLLLSNKIALWDVLSSCEIVGSSDSSIKNETPNDIANLIYKTNIKRIYLNGKTAEKYYKKHLQNKIEIKAACLPSSSPANAAFSLDRLVLEWSQITKG